MKRNITITILFAVFLYLLFNRDILMYLDPVLVRNSIEGAGIMGPIIFIFVYILSAVLFLPGTPFTLMAGVLFGPIFGSLYVIIGATLGATVAFLLSRTVLHKFADNLFSKFSSFKKYNRAIREKGLETVLFLRLVPLFPYNALNYILGITELKFKDYFLATLFGMIPGIFVYVYFGDSLASLNIWKIAIAVILVLFLILFTHMYRKTKNKLAENEYDVIVIGAGSGGLNIAGFMNRADFKVLLVDKKAESIGGDCLNFGCVPSKSFIHVARLFRDAKKAKRFGINSKGKADIKKIMNSIKDKQNKFRTRESLDYFRSIGMDVQLGEASFNSENSILLNDKEYIAGKIVLASGARPRELKIEGVEDQDIYTNETIFDISFLPESLVVVGGGPIGIELGQAFNYLGSKVTIIDRGEEILPKEDKDIATTLRKTLEEEGIRIISEASVESATGKTLKVKSKETSVELAYDAILNSTGRVLNTEGLNLKKAGIEKESNRIKVDEYLRTTNKNILLCGDVAGSYQFTHVAEIHAGVILKNFFSPFKKKVSYDNISWVTFTSPEVATFGLQEKEIKKRGIKYEVLKDNFSEDDRAITDSYPSSLLKLFISGDKILGGTMIAPSAGELIQELVLAKYKNLDIGDIFNKTYAYPVATRINKRVISSYKAKKLTKRAKKLLKLLY